MWLLLTMPGVPEASLCPPQELPLTPLSTPQLYSSWNSLKRMWGERQKHLEDQLQASVTDQATMEVRRASRLGTRRHGRKLLARKECTLGTWGGGFSCLLLRAGGSGDQPASLPGTPGRGGAETEVWSPSGAPFRLLFLPEQPL